MKRLQEETMCKMAVLGRGSMKDRQKVRALRAAPHTHYYSSLFPSSLGVRFFYYYFSFIFLSPPARLFPSESNYRADNFAGTSAFPRGISSPSSSPDLSSLRPASRKESAAFFPSPSRMRDVPRLICLAIVDSRYFNFNGIVNFFLSLLFLNLARSPIDLHPVLLFYRL